MFGRALFDDPLSVHFIPNPGDRKRSLHHFFHFLIRVGQTYGQVYATSRALEGAAVWWPGEVARGPLLKNFLDADRLIRKVGSEAMARFEAMGAFAGRIHLRYAPGPHWYLVLLAVDALHQGRGHATRLLGPMLDRLDQEGLPCYLETHNRQNVPVYRRFGFEMAEETLIPGTGTRHWAMLRPPIDPAGQGETEDG